LSVSLAYYHQYSLALSYTILGGGTPRAPQVSGVHFGEQYSGTLGSQAAYFFDSGSQWAVQGVLSQATPTTNNPGERWATSQNVSGSASAGSKLALVYHHQYYLTTTAGPAAGGTTGNSTGWFDSGSSVQLSATAAPGWKFAGWAGSGKGSYSGPNQSSIQADGPITEAATFYPGLTITAGSNVAVVYSYLSQSGTVRAGTTLTVYAPEGTSIWLSANPSSIFFQFGGWAPASTGSSGVSTLTLDSPSAVHASFSINPVAVGGGIAGLIVVVAVVAFLMKSRRKSKSSKPKESTPAWLEPLRKSQTP
jgi:hypothetical protein